MHTCHFFVFLSCRIVSERHTSNIVKYRYVISVFKRTQPTCIPSFIHSFIHSFMHAYIHKNNNFLDEVKVLKLLQEERKDMFYLTMHSTHFIYGYMALDIW